VDYATSILMSHRKEVDLDKLFSVMVFNISYRTRKEDLHRSFDKFGEIADVYVPKDIHGESRGFGFVRYYDRRDAEDALVMDGSLLDGRRVGVQMAKYGPRHGRRRSRSPRPMRRFRSKSHSSPRHSKKKRSTSRSRSRSRSRGRHSRRTYRSASKSYSSRSGSRHARNHNSSYNSRSRSRSHSGRPSGASEQREKDKRVDNREKKEENGNTTNEQNITNTTTAPEKSGSEIHTAEVSTV